MTIVKELLQAGLLATIITVNGFAMFDIYKINKLTDNMHFMAFVAIGLLTVVRVCRINERWNCRNNK